MGCERTRLPRGRLKTPYWPVSTNRWRKRRRGSRIGSPLFRSRASSASTPLPPPSCIVLGLPPPGGAQLLYPLRYSLLYFRGPATQRGALYSYSLLFCRGGSAPAQPPLVLVGPPIGPRRFVAEPVAATSRGVRKYALARERIVHWTAFPV